MRQVLNMTQGKLKSASIASSLNPLCSNLQVQIYFKVVLFLNSNFATSLNISLCNALWLPASGARMCDKSSQIIVSPAALSAFEEQQSVLSSRSAVRRFAARAASTLAALWNSGGAVPAAGGAD